MPGIVVPNSSGLNPLWVQEKVIFEWASRNNVFSRWVGKSPLSVIREYTELQKNPGDAVRATVFGKLTGEGKDGDAILEGQEEAMQPYQDTLYIDQKRHAVRVNGRMTEQRSAIKLRMEGGSLLGTWMADWMSLYWTYQLAGRRGTRVSSIIPLTYTGFGLNALRVPDATHSLWAGPTGLEAGMTAGDFMSAALLRRLSRRISLLINANVPMRPPIEGEFFPIYITPEQAEDLKNDPRYEAAMLLAQNRGESNPIFKGSLGIYDGLVVYVNPAGVTFANSNGIATAQATVLGSNAAACGWGGNARSLGASKPEGMGRNPGDAPGSWSYAEELFDYENQVGMACATITGFQRLQFNNMDANAFTLYTSYSA